VYRLSDADGFMLVAIRLARIGYNVISPIPETCKNRKIKKPDNPAHASELALGVTTIYILKKLFEDDGE